MLIEWSWLWVSSWPRVRCLLLMLPAGDLVAGPKVKGGVGLACLYRHRNRGKQHAISANTSKHQAAHGAKPPVLTSLDGPTFAVSFHSFTVT
jgi:hypothetical protein